ncbi:hypothetical protein Cgig2_026223 [Carnegiea gigantea]|uniref:Uncharacterized protein n=1 Tax=Carnegiea gigantea TaxID=171969 RepID=A0A9Q1KIH3_9CARY|nr:hypothetical protein Cgig2_026223 [Carnegiea gigantea]
MQPAPPATAQLQVAASPPESEENKRFWTKENEWALVHGLLELSADPQWKAEGNFKSRATRARCEDYVEAVDNLYNDNRAINLDNDGEDEEEEDNGINSHLEIIASAFATTQQHEQVILVRELHLDQKQKEFGEKKGLFNEVMKIPRLTSIEAMMAVRKLVSNESSLSICYERPEDEWKEDFIINLIHPDLSPSH